MSKEIIINFHQSLSKRADYGAAGEKPVFLMAVLRYMLAKDVFGVSLIALLHPMHRLRMKSHFLYFAGMSGRLRSPNRSWDMVAGKEHLEIGAAVDDYVANTADVSKAFAKLTRSDARVLLDGFVNELKESLR